jgi:hypothetical protein
MEGRITTPLTMPGMHLMTITSRSTTLSIPHPQATVKYKSAVKVFHTAEDMTHHEFPVLRDTGHQARHDASARWHIRKKLQGATLLGGWGQCWRNISSLCQGSTARVQRGKRRLFVRRCCKFWRWTLSLPRWVIEVVISAEEPLRPDPIPGSLVVLSVYHDNEFVLKLHFRQQHCGCCFSQLQKVGYGGLPVFRLLCSGFLQLFVGAKHSEKQPKTIC